VPKQASKNQSVEITRKIIFCIRFSASNLILQRIPVIKNYPARKSCGYNLPSRTKTGWQTQTSYYRSAPIHLQVGKIWMPG
jgi:hypothetical protein